MRSLYFVVLLLFVVSGAAAGTLCGQVTDQVSGDPIALAGVFVHQDGAWTGDTAATDAGGHFCLDLAPGVYSLEVRLDDHVDAWVDGIVVAAEPTDVALPIARPPVFLAAPWPNPASPSTKLRLTVNRTTDVELGVYDIRGRLVRRWAASAAAPGELVHEWDGLDSAGRPVVQGVYLIRARADGEIVTRKLMVIR